MGKNRKPRQSIMETDNQLNEISLAEAVKLVDFDDEIGSMVHPTFSQIKGLTWELWRKKRKRVMMRCSERIGGS